MLASRAPRATVLVRLMVGAVFLSEGAQKFLFADTLGTGRFERIGIPAPELLAPMVAVLEMACGGLLLLGFAVRLAAVPLIAIMLVAIVTTKAPLLLSRGFLHMAHGSRTDWSMLLGAIFLLIVGAGPWSLDARLTNAPDSTSPL